MKTKAAKLVAPKRFEVVDVELPQIARDEVLIKVIACGICTTELPVFDGLVVGTPGVSFRYKEYPASLGHEVVGTVVTAGEDAAGFTPGDPVTGMTYSGCGFAQHMIEKANKLVKVPADVRLEHALGEPLMSVVNVMRQAAPEFGDDVFIVGDGFLSLLLVAGLTLSRTSSSRDTTRTGCPWQ
jgi:NADPH:quinone reductase-like Zn-dependent oxidoreductase